MSTGMFDWFYDVHCPRCRHACSRGFIVSKVHKHLFCVLMVCNIIYMYTLGFNDVRITIPMLCALCKHIEASSDHHWISSAFSLQHA